jgi:galactose mutarotase-like enzyme
MYNIELEKRLYPTYILEDRQAQSQIEVVPERGGIITAWRIRARHLLYLDRDRFADPNLSVRGGIPILFPICGNLPDNTYSEGGKQYTLKQHGFARDLPWEVKETQTDSCASITLVLNSSDRTLAVYPFDFQLTFTYQLQGNTLKLQQRFTNYSQQRMPFSVGLHPYFFVKDKTQLQFDIPASQYQDQISKTVYPFKGEFDFNLGEIDAAFVSISKHFTSMRDRDLEIKISYSDAYSTLVFWTVKGKDYVCLEPWSAPRNSLITGESLIYLEPETSCDAVVEMSVTL